MKIAAIIDDRFPSVWTNTQQVAQTVSNLGALGEEVKLIVPRMADSLSLSKEERIDRICDFYGIPKTFILEDIITFPADLIDIGWRPEKITHGIVAPILASIQDYDLIYTRNLLPLLLGITFKKPVIFETYRLLPKEKLGVGVLFSHLFNKIGKNPYFLGLVTHSKLARKEFINVGVPKEKTITIHNGIDPKQFEPRLSKQQARQLTSLPLNSKIVVYTGHMSKGKGIELLLDMASFLPNVLFVLVGGPTQKDINRIQNLTKKKSLKNVRIVGWVKPKKLPPFLYSADVLIIPPSSEPLKQKGHTVLPIKVFTYLVAKKPILAPDLPDTQELLIHGQNSWRVPPDDPQEAAQYLQKLLNNQEVMDSIAKEAYRTAQSFTWQKRAEKLKTFMQERLDWFVSNNHK